MSRKPREAIVFLLDVGCNMNQEYGDSGTTFFQSSKECIAQIIQRKIFSDARDELGLIIFGSEKTDNVLATGKEYRNIAVVTENLQYPNWELLKYLHELRSSEGSCGDWLDAIVVAMQFIKDKTTNYQSIYHHKIVVFSNFVYKVLDDQVDAIVGGINGMGVSFVVIGPDVNKTAYSPGKPKSADQQAGETLITKIVQKVNGVFCSFEEAFAELMYFQRKSVKPTPWNALFKISEKIKIPIQMFKKISEPSYRKWSTKILDDEEAGVVKERAFVKFDEDNETEVEVSKESVINAYQFGSTVVPFSDIDKETMRYSTGEKGLYFIGCARKDRIPLHLLIGDGSYVVLTRPGDNFAKMALEAFVQALFERNCVGVARRIYNRDTTTTVGALFPIVTDESRYLVFAQLPFAEDEHVFRFPSLADVKPSDEQIKAVDDLIEMMDLDATDTRPEKYDITKIYDHNEQYIFKCLSYKALYPENSLPEELKLNGISALKADPKLIETCRTQLERIRNVFPLDEVPEKPKRTAFRKPTTDPSNDSVPVTTTLFQNGTISNTADTNNDFISILQSKLPADEFSTIQSHINDVINSSSLDLSTTLNVLKSLHKLFSNDPKPFHLWIEHLKDKLCQTNNLSIWEKIVDEKLNVINENISSNDEVFNKVPEISNPRDEDADSQYGTQMSNSIDDLLDNI